MNSLAKKIIHNSKSFKELNKTLEKLTKTNKSKLAGDIFEYLTKLYLEISPEYKSKLNKVYLLNEVPNNIKIKLKLPRTDEGIDLIAETFDREYWAIQCKYRSNNNETLKVKGDLATFNNLAFTVCKNISHGIVCSTVNRPPKKTKLLNSIGFELLTTWLGLDKNNKELFKQIRSKAIGKVIKPKKLSPKEHQKLARSKTIEHFKKNNRGKLIMPCGTGKSLTAFWIAEKMQSKSILIAVPSLSLLQQTLKVWTREFLLNNIQPDWLCICSDDTVKEEQDDFVTFSSDLGIKVDTDPRVIRDFLKRKTSKIKVVFTTYQSGRATAIGSKGFVYDLGIMDEAHKTVGSKSKEMAHLLHQKNIKINKRLFMTATERLFKSSSDEYMSMDDPKDYGKLIYELSFKEAINSKPPIISDYKIITFGITNPEIEAITQDNKYLRVKKELKDVTARELATAIALRKAIKKLKIKNAISFHRSIERADNFRKQQDLISKIYSSYGKLKTFHVRGDMPTSDRAIEMLSFEEEQGLMTNARCLTEGVDLPAIDCVCFTDPKRSKVDIVQAAGRALRLSKGKKFGYILIPIFIPDGMTFDEAAEEQGFDDVSITVRALATTDKRIVEYLRTVSEGKKPRGGSPVDGITSINELYKVEAEKFNKAVQLKIWDKVVIGNYKSYEEAKAFAKMKDIRFARQWRELNRNDELPKDIPYSVETVYKSDWISWPSFLNTKNRSRYINFQSYEKASAFAKSLKISSAMEWRKNSKSEKFPINIPVNPDNYYKNWKGWGEFLGTKNTATQHKNYKSYSYAKKYAHKFNFKNKKEWHKHVNSRNFPSDIPKTVDAVYKKKNQWIDWGDFLGTKFVARKFRKYRSFDEAKKYVISKNIRTYKDWKKHTKSKNFPKDIPVALKTYNEWVDAVDFFGPRPTRETNYRSFEKAKKYAKQKKIFTKENWFKHTKSKNFPKDIPVAVSSASQYKSKWKGWPDFLGKK